MRYWLVTFLVLMFGLSCIEVEAREIDELIDVGGYRLHIQCSGSGTPAVILESGMGGPGFSWFSVFREISKSTLVCNYDRAGCAKSDVSPLPRTLDNMGKELDTLLKNANIPGPYLLVGHSFGGILVREFEHRNPNQVLGIILVDPSHEYQESEPKFPDRSLSKKISKIYENQKIRSERDNGTLSLEEIQRVLDYDKEKKNQECGSKEGALFSENLLQMQKRGDIGHKPLGNKPITVIIAGKSQNSDQPKILPFLTESEKEVFVEFNKNRETDTKKRKQGLAQLSSKGEYIIAEHSGHFVQFIEPDLIVQAVLKLLKATRLYPDKTKPSNTSI